MPNEAGKEESTVSERNLGDTLLSLPAKAFLLVYSYEALKGFYNIESTGRLPMGVMIDELFAVSAALFVARKIVRRSNNN